MITMTCKCGEELLYTSMGATNCQGCEKCNTSFNRHPIDVDGEMVWENIPLEPHEWMEKFNQNTGKPYKICKHCYQVDRESYDLSKIK